MSHLTTALVARDPAELDALVDAAPPARRGSGAVGGRRARGHGRRPDRRFRELAEAGVGEVAVRLVDLVDAEPIARMAPVIAAFR